MPVFTAPSDKKDEAPPPPPPPPPPPSKIPLILAITAAAIVLFGIGLYVALAPSGPKAKKEMSDEDKKMLMESFGNNKKGASTATGTSPDTASDTTSKANGKNGKSSKNVAADNAAADATSAKDHGEILKMALKQLRDSSLANDKQRSKAFCRQMAAEANAIAGNVVDARDHLSQLATVGQEVSYYRIVPLLELNRVELAAGDKKDATKTLNLAMAEVPRIPKFGRTRLEIASRLAASLAVADRIPEALAMLTIFQSKDSEAQLAARMQMANDGRIAALTDSASVLPWKSPQTSAAMASLVFRGQTQVAIAWAAALPDDDARVEALSIWAQETARQNAPVGSADVDGTIASAVELLSAPLAARIWARAGCGRFLAKDAVGTARAIELAKGKLASIPVPAELVMPTVRTTIRFKLPTSNPLYRAATAAAEIAFIEAQSSGSKADAESSLDMALSFIRGTAPTFAAASNRLEESERGGSGDLREFLRKELKLKDDDEARRAAIDYKRVLNDIVEAARLKFEFETQILSRLRGAGVGLNSKVWIVVSTRSFADDINQRDNFFATGLPGELVEAMPGTDEERAILGAWRRWSKDPAPPRPPLIVFNKLLQTDIPGAVNFVQTIDTKFNRREEILLRTASNLSATGRLSTAFQLISKLDDLVVREECYRFAASIAAQRGETEQVWKQVGLVQQQTEKAALCRGLVGGAQSTGKPANDFPDPVFRP